MVPPTSFAQGNALIDTHKLDWHADRVGQWRENPLKTYPIYIEVTPAGACNHRCTFCAVDYIGYKTVYLNPDRWQEIVKELGKKGVRSIMFAGEGEPLLHKDIIRIIKDTKYAGIDVALTTNAVGLTERFVREALPYITWIKASIDAGTPKTHAAIHQCPTNHFPRIISNLEHAARFRTINNLTCSIGGQLLLGKQNMEEAVMLGETLRKCGCDLYVVKPYSQHHSSLNQEGDFLQGLTYHDSQKIDCLEEELKQLNTAGFTSVFRRESMESYYDPERHYDKCRATPNFWAYIMATGDVYSCSAYLLDERFKLGNINEALFSDIWEGERRQEHLRFVEQDLDITECRKNCRMHKVNQRLHHIATNNIDSTTITPEADPPYNVNFI